MSDNDNPETNPRTLVKDFCFNKSQIAVALSIAKSKPPSLTTKEFIVRLNSQVKPRSTSPKLQHTYIDSATFWKDHCTKLYDENQVLESQNSELRKQIEEKQSAQNSFQARLSESEARRASLQDRVEAASNPTIQLQIHRQEHTGSEMEEARQVRSFNQEACNIAAVQHTEAPRTLYKDQETVTFDEDAYTQRLLKQHSGVDIQSYEKDTPSSLLMLNMSQVLYSQLLDKSISPDALICSVQKTLLHTLIDIQEWSTGQLPDHLIRSGKVVAEIIDYCFRSLTHLCRDITGRRSKASLISTLVEFFNDVLAIVKANCIAVTRLTKHTSQHKTRRRAADHADDTCEQDRQTDTVLPALIKLLFRILTSSELSNPGIPNSELGKRLFSLLFDRLTVLVVSRENGINRLLKAKAAGDIPNDEETSLREEERAIEVEIHNLTEAVQQVLRYHQTHNSSLLLAEMTERNGSNSKDDQRNLLGPAMKRFQEALRKSGR